MILPLRYILFFIFFFALPLLANSQQLTEKDKKEIKARAAALVEECQALMNFISNTDVYQSEINEVIANSYGNSGNKIFVGEDVIIEDDIDPSQTNLGQTRDMPIKTYLRNLDLLYEPTSEPSIDFSNVKVSSIAQRDYVFVRVYFESQFKSRHINNLEVPYQKTERVAEIKAIPGNGKWNAQIASITFYNPDKPLQFEEDIEELASSAVHGNAKKNGKESENKQVFYASNANLAIDASSPGIYAELKQENLSTFNELINQADFAFQHGRYAEAVELYTEASEKRPYEIHSRRRIEESKSLLKISNNSTKVEIINELNTRGQNALRVRDYVNAKKYFNEILAMEYDPQLETQIQNIDKKLRRLSALESKYLAGNYEEGIKEYRKAIRENSDNADFYLGRGKCYLALKYLEEPDKPFSSSKYAKDALSDFSTAIEKDIKFEEALYERAKLYRYMKMYHEAIADYTIIISNKPSAQYLNEKAAINLLLNKHESALEDYEHAIGIEPQYASSYYNKGKLLNHLKQYERALASLEQAIALDTEFPDAYFQKGLALVALKRVEEAAQEFEFGIALGLGENKKSKIDQIVENYYMQGTTKINDRSYESAIKSLENVLILSPDHHRAWYQRGNAYYNLENYEQAIESYDFAIENKEKYVEALFQRGLAYEKLHKIALSNTDLITANKASIEFMQRIGDHRNSVYQMYANYAFRASEKIGNNFLLQSQYDSATFFYDQAKAINDEKAEVYNKAGWCRYLLQEYQNSLIDLKTALKLDPQLAEAYYHRGLVYLATGEMKSAVYDFNEAVKLRYDSAKVYYHLGRTFQLQEDYENAVTAYTNAVIRDTTMVEGYYQRAKSYAKIENHQYAIADYERILKLAPAMGVNNFYRELGYLHLNLNQPKNALRAFGEAYQLEKDDDQTIYGVACAYTQLGDVPNALTYFAQAFASGGLVWKNVKKDPHVTNIKSHKEFKKLVKTYLK